MNAPVLPPPPRRYSAADILHLLDLGVVDRDARFELVDGALIAMSPKGRHHEIMREKVAEWVQSVLIRGLRALQEHTLILEDGLMLEPDFILYDAARRIADAPLTGADLRLVIEVADSSLDYDLNTKAPRFAVHGAGEYWVIDAVRGDCRIHRGATAQGWADIRDVPKGQPLEALCAPGAPLVI